MSESDAAGYTANVLDKLAADLTKRATEAGKLARIAWEEADLAKREGDMFHEVCIRLTNAVRAIEAAEVNDAECVMAKASTR